MSDAQPEQTDQEPAGDDAGSAQPVEVEEDDRGLDHDYPQEVTD